MLIIMLIIKRLHAHTHTHPQHNTHNTETIAMSESVRTGVGHVAEQQDERAERGDARERRVE